MIDLQLYILEVPDTYFPVTELKLKEKVRIVCVLCFVTFISDFCLSLFLRLGVKDQSPAEGSVPFITI